MEPQAAAAAASGGTKRPRASTQFPDDVLPLVFRHLADPVAICAAACVASGWRVAAQDPSAWAEADVGAAVRRYVHYHRCAARDDCVARVGTQALRRTKLFRAWTAWCTTKTARTELEASKAAQIRCDRSPAQESLQSIWAHPSSSDSRNTDDGDGVNMAKTLHEWGVTDGSRLHVDDDSTELRHTLCIHDAPHESQAEGATALLARLAFHRACARERLNKARRRFHVKVDVSLGAPATGMASVDLFGQTAIWNSPEDSVKEQDPRSCTLADDALLHIIGPDFAQSKHRLSQLQSLDLQELGMHCCPLENVYECAAGSLKNVNLDRCRLVDGRQSRTNAAFTPRDTEPKEQTRYEVLRELMVSNGVDVTDLPDIISLAVVDLAGIKVFFKMRARHRLAKLMTVYTLRMGGGHGGWQFFYRPDTPSGHAYHAASPLFTAGLAPAVQLKWTDTPRRLDMPEDCTIEAHRLPLAATGNLVGTAPMGGVVGGGVAVEEEEEDEEDEEDEEEDEGEQESAEEGGA